MSFDRLAPHYRWMEQVLAGRKLQRCRTEFLDRIPPPRRILSLGEGPGRFLAECARRFPGAEITCVDASERMLFEARRGLTRDGLLARNAVFVHSNIFDWKASEPHDLIATHFFLDCFRPDQLKDLVARIAAASDRKANWLLADFQAASEGLKRIRSRAILFVMYRFFRVAARLPARSLTAPDPFLRDAGFNLRARTVSEWELLRSDWWQRDE
jgi:SAM-dependent methyltransferase